MGTDTPVGMVRRRVVLVVLSCMLLALAALLLLRARVEHDAPQVQPQAAASASALPSASAAASASAAPSAAPPALPQLSLPRPLRIAASGWDVAAPAILANDGLEPGKGSVHAAAGLTAQVMLADGDKGVEAALARGGTDKQGADVGLLPLAELVGGYERMRALGPQVVLVTGWSRGREGLWSQRDSLVTVPKAATLAGVRADAPSLLALFALELAGMPASSLGVPDDKTPATFVAAERRADAPPPAGKLLLTSADTPRLIPMVAVAQAGFIDKHGDVLVAWARGFLEGQRVLQQDAADAARRLGALPGAPEPLVLVRRFGEIAPAPLYDNARMAGLTGRSPITTEQLFLRTWQLFRDARVLTTPPPETLPVTSSIVAQLVRSSEQPPVPPDSRPQARGQGQVLLTARLGQRKLDDPLLVADVGLIAGVFERSVLRLGVVGLEEARTRKLIQTIAERFELAAGRLVAAKAVQGERGAVVVEVLAVP